VQRDTVYNPDLRKVKPSAIKPSALQFGLN
jgi:hypothetical protein